MGDSLIGSTIWIFKNSWGIASGDMGYVYLIADVSDITPTTNYYLSGKVLSFKHSNTDIVVKDNDGDGYCFWGVGERPERTPAWAQIEPDGDDSNPSYGPIDSLGFLQRIVIDSYSDVIVDSSVIWDNDNYLYNNIRIVNGGKLTISDSIMKYPTSNIHIDSGGELVVDKGCIMRGNITVSANATLSLINGGRIILDDLNALKIEENGTLYIRSGYLELTN